MKPFSFFIIALIFFASAAGGVFILKQEKEVFIENIPATGALTPGALTPGVSPSTSGAESGVETSVEPSVESTSTPEIQNEDFVKKSEETILQAQALIMETEKFLEEEKAKAAAIIQIKERSDKIKGIYVGGARNFSSFYNLLDETELNALVIDIKESYGANLSSSLKGSIAKLHEKDVWAIARIVVFRDSSLIEEKPDWYLTFASTTEATATADATTTNSLWQDNAKQYWLNPENEEVVNYIIDFSKKAIDYGFDELQFDYIRYPDDYNYISGEEKIKAIGDFFSKISDSLRNYKPTVMLSADLFGYVATQFNSYGTGQRLSDAGKYFDYLSFMLYPSHFYGGFAAKGIRYFYPEVVENPYDVIYYSVASARDYLALFGFETKIRPWLQDFNLAVDLNRGIVYDSEKIRFQIDGAENATSSGWLLWNPSNLYTRDALK
ncbi:MAG: hypothetical protein HYW69_00350 [Candidatus Nealsonbacteria bacterium]|nr:hypothetical protein [Candidatus Nealsonbacteria bacterium]